MDLKCLFSWRSEGGLNMKGISERAGRVQMRAWGQFPIIVIYYLGQIVTLTGQPDG